MFYHAYTYVPMVVGATLEWLACSTGYSLRGVTDTTAVRFPGKQTLIPATGFLNVVSVDTEQNYPSVCWLLIVESEEMLQTWLFCCTCSCSSCGVVRPKSTFHIRRWQFDRSYQYTSSACCRNRLSSLYMLSGKGCKNKLSIINSDWINIHKVWNSFTWIFTSVSRWLRQELSDKQKSIARFVYHYILYHPHCQFSGLSLLEIKMPNLGSRFNMDGSVV